MKVLFIGGTGTISTAIVKRCAEELRWDVWVLNRGTRSGVLPAGVRQIAVDIGDEEKAAALLAEHRFDAVCEFIGFVPAHVERDWRLFRGKTNQYVYISSASAYHKPAASWLITEGTALANPFWRYSRDKIACEEFLMAKYREEGFPVTIVRPSHTYDERSIPVGVHGAGGSWQVIRRMKEGKPVIVQGDGSSLWTLTFNSDFAAGFTGLIGSRRAIGEAFQITGDEVLTWDQIYLTIGDALGVAPKLYHVASDWLADAGRKAGYDFTGSLIGDKSVSVVFDNAKLRRLSPDMRTTVPFHLGVRRCLAYIETHPECQVEDPAFDAWCDRVIAAQEAAKAGL